MTSLLVALLFQSLLLPPRVAVENPAVVSPIPPKIQKDYDKLWTRFVTGKEDARLLKDLDNLFKKQKDLDAIVTIEAYLDLYKGNDASAAQRFEQALAINPNNRIALYYLAELAYGRQNYARASSLYARLMSIDKTRTDLEPKRQKAFLLAADNLLRSAARSEAENRLGEAEEFYRQALNLAPNEPALHTQLSTLLAREGKTDEAAAEKKIAEELRPNRRGPSGAGGEKLDDLEDLGRWGKDIEVFHEIRAAEAITREQTAALMVRYFPQTAEFRQTSQIVTDVQSSWAASEIQIITGIGLIEPLPNHTFEPATPVTRGDFAVALARLIRLLGLPTGSGAPVATPDVAPTNARYADIQLVLGYGLMTLPDPDGFNVSANLSGREAVRAVDKLLRAFQQTQR